MTQQKSMCVWFVIFLLLIATVYVASYGQKGSLGQSTVRQSESYRAVYAVSHTSHGKHVRWAENKREVPFDQRHWGYTGPETSSLA